MQSNFCLILPDIRSCHNVEAMFRIADGSGCDMIYLVGYTPHPPKHQIDKVSLGAEKTVPWKHRKHLVPLIRTLQKQGYRIISLEKTATSTSIFDTPTSLWQGNVALVVGNEVDGVDDKVLSHSYHIVHIPMRGHKESLNVSVAGGIASYHIAEARSVV